MISNETNIIVKKESMLNSQTGKYFHDNSMHSTVCAALWMNCMFMCVPLCVHRMPLELF